MKNSVCVQVRKFGKLMTWLADLFQSTIAEEWEIIQQNTVPGMLNTK